MCRCANVIMGMGKVVNNVKVGYVYCKCSLIIPVFSIDKNQKFDSVSN